MLELQTFLAGLVGKEWSGK